MPLAGATVKAYNGWEQDTVVTLETTSSTSFTDLATVGPTVVVHLDVGQSCMIIGEVAMFVAAAGVNGAVWAPQVDGPSTSDLTASNNRLVGENSQLHKEVEVLRELVTARAAVDQLTSAVQNLERTLIT